jgi:hypothetical protein
MYVAEKSLRLARELFPEIHPQWKKAYHACFIYRRNKLLSIGVNEPTRPSAIAFKFARKYGGRVRFPYLHAEISAISKLIGRHNIGSDLKIVVIRINKSGELMFSRPCKHCRKVLDAFCLTKIYYSTPEGISPDV